MKLDAITLERRSAKIPRRRKIKGCLLKLITNPCMIVDRFGRIAQLVELLSYTQVVIGSSPVAPITPCGSSSIG